MKLRDYQQAAVNAVIENWKTARSCLIVLPTGCGKTVVFGEVICRLLDGGIVASVGGKGAAVINALLKNSRLGVAQTECRLSRRQFDKVMKLARERLELFFAALTEWRSQQKCTGKAFIMALWQRS